MKINVTKVRAEADVHFDISGSVLAGTIMAGAPKVETRYEIESPDEPEKVAAMLRNAKNGCWVRAAVANPMPRMSRARQYGSSRMRVTACSP